MRVVHDAPALRSRLWSLRQEVHDNPEAPPRVETGAAPADPTPGLMAGRIGRLHQTVMSAVGRGTMAGRGPVEVSRELLVLPGRMEDLLGDKALNYAVRAVD